MTSVEDVILWNPCHIGGPSWTEVIKQCLTAFLTFIWAFAIFRSYSMYDRMVEY
jgi:hypothetical protein